MNEKTHSNAKMSFMELVCNMNKHLIFTLTVQICLLIIVESAILHPRILNSIPNLKEVNPIEIDNGRWYGEDANDVIREINKIIQNHEKRGKRQTDSFMDRFLALFSQNNADLSNPPEEWKHQQNRNNCFFTPMNCRIAPKHGAAVNGAKVFMISDEQKQKLLARHGHKLRQKKKQIWL